MPVIYYADARAQRLGFLQVMSRVENRGSRRAKATDEFKNVQPRLRINSHSRFVEQKKFGPVRRAQPRLMRRFMPPE